MVMDIFDGMMTIIVGFFRVVFSIAIIILFWPILLFIWIFRAF